MANLMNNEPGSKPEEAAKKSAQFTEEMLKVRASMELPRRKAIRRRSRIWTRWSECPGPGSAAAAATPATRTAPAPPPAAARGRAGPGASDLPFTQSVFEAGIWIDGSDPDLTKIDIRPGEARDMNILPHANVANPGPVVPRQFLTVLAKGDTTFKHGSGRLELADESSRRAAPLAARVIVNRVWGWHFGKPLVATDSDFGVQGDKPTHPELLDDLAARFIANGWSLKWLHREIMLSAAYRQSSHPRAEGLAERSDQCPALAHESRAAWTSRPIRDNLLQVSADLESKAPPLSLDLDAADNHAPHRVWPCQPRTPEYAAGALRFPRPDDDSSAARADHVAAAAVVCHEQPFHAGARRPSGESRERRSRTCRQRFAACIATPWTAIPTVAGTGHGIDLSEQRQRWRNSRRPCWRPTR